jgi:hypothetical protein
LTGTFYHDIIAGEGEDVMENETTFYKDGTVGFVGANGKWKRVTAEDIRAEDLAALSKEKVACILEMVATDDG